MSTSFFRGRFFALLQIFALMFIVTGGLLSFAQIENGESGVAYFCEGDHEKCGCDPALVAAKACCCHLRGPLAQKAAVAQESPCCAGDDEHPDETCLSDVNDRGGEPTHWIGVPTCGGGVKLLASFALKLDFSLAQSALPPRPAAGGIVPAIEPEPWASVAPEVPVPPPRAA